MFNLDAEAMDEDTWARRYNEAIFIEEWRLKNFAMLFKE